MDKRQAVEFLEYLRQDRNLERTIYGDALNMAIEALKAQLFSESTTSDLISKTKTAEHLRRVLDATVPVSDYDEGYVDGVEFGISTVSTMPTIQPERQRGEWIEISSINHTYKCSECGRLLVNITDGKNNVAKNYPYCHCGADMRGESE